MPITVDPGTHEIYVPQNYLTLISGIRYALDVNQLRLDLRDWEDSEIGIVEPVSHIHKTTTVLSGVTYARIFEILSPYTVAFEDTMAHYTVVCEGANHNIADVMVTSNTVNLIVGNSAGLIEVNTGSGLTPTQSAMLEELHQASFNRRFWDKVGDTITIYDTDNITPLFVFDTNADLSDITPQ